MIRELVYFTRKAQIHEAAHLVIAHQFGVPGHARVWLRPDPDEDEIPVVGRFWMYRNPPDRASMISIGMAGAVAECLLHTYGWWEELRTWDSELSGGPMPDDERREFEYSLDPMLSDDELSCPAGAAYAFQCAEGLGMSLSDFRLIAGWTPDDIDRTFDLVRAHWSEIKLEARRMRLRRFEEAIDEQDREA